MSSGVLGNDVARLKRRGEEVEEQEPEVPSENEYVDEEASDLIEDTHIAYNFAVSKLCGEMCFESEEEMNLTSKCQSSLQGRHTECHITISNCVRAMMVKFAVHCTDGTKPVIYAGFPDQRTNRRLQASDLLDVHHHSTCTKCSLTSAPEKTYLALWLRMETIHAVC
jgi:hypothetical protein